MLTKRLQKCTWTALFAATTCYAASAQSRFEPAIRIGPSDTARAPFDLDACDLNGDGDLDFVIPFSGNPSIQVSLSDGLGGYLPEFQLPFAVGGTGQGPKVIETLDVDGDGLVDILSSFRSDASSPSSIFWFRNTGAGSVEAPVALSAPFPGSLFVLETVDLNGDGIEEIVAASQGGQQGFVLSRSTASSAFTSTTLFQGIGNGVDDMDFGDLDGDGDLDIVVGVTSLGRVYAIENLGGGSYAAPATLIDEPGFGRLVSVLDADSDGTLDVAAFTIIGGSIEFLIQGDTTFTTWTREPGVPVNVATSLDVGDIDLDGDEDILLHTVTGSGDGATLFINQGPLQFEEAFYDWNALLISTYSGFLDVNGDGALDVVTSNGFASLVYTQVDPRVGSAFCAGIPNSTGAVGQLHALGSDTATINALRVAATNLPPNQFGIALVSRSENGGYQPLGAFGTLCIGTLAGAGIGRYDDPSEIFAASSIGLASVDLNLTETPFPAGTFAATAGDTLRYQLWHRDQVAGAAASNFTAAVRVTLR